jgi:molybdopterin biosynthesis enzyme
MRYFIDFRGSSVGVKDGAAHCVSSLGELLFSTALRVKPGKPAFAGTIGKTLVLGLPGIRLRRTSCLNCLRGPQSMPCLARPRGSYRTAKLNAAVPSNTGREE